MSSTSPESERNHAGREPSFRDEEPIEAEVASPPLPEGTAGSDTFVASENASGEPPRRRRRVSLPVILFVLTCLSTFFVGAAQWEPDVVFMQMQSQYGVDLTPVRRTILTHWQEGLTYSFLLLAILFTHEMGHFIATLRHKVPATLPFFLPFPINPIGTLGAVIAMDGRRADRRQTFDIGIAGPIAGLVLAVPIVIFGITQLEPLGEVQGRMAFESPLAVRMLLAAVKPAEFGSTERVWISQVQDNPWFMAGWVGLLITGLNMLPVSQLDGGHVTYCLFGKAAHWIARLTMVGWIAFVVFSQAYWLMLMIVLVLLMNPDHPPTRDDSAKLGWFRTSLGLVSLLIPILCFPPKIFTLGG